MAVERPVPACGDIGMFCRCTVFHPSPREAVEDVTRQLNSWLQGDPCISLVEVIPPPVILQEAQFHWRKGTTTRYAAMASVNFVYRCNDPACKGYAHPRNHTLPEDVEDDDDGEGWKRGPRNN